MRSLQGRTLGHYRLAEQIGAGGMAVVYKAFDATLDRHVAVKVLPEYLANDEEFSLRFRAEARNVARLEHPNILPIYGYGEEDGLAYFVVALVRGGTLKDLMGKPVDAERAVFLLSQVADALHYAHQAGIVHRDVKPANVLLSRPDWALLSDFGIARVMEQTSTFTRSGTGYLGTPHYMAPEQARGEPISPRTDQYALGIVLYEMLTGTPPFQADTPQAVVYQHIFSPLPLPHERNPNVPEAMERVILTALAKDPADRFPDMAAFAAAAHQAVGGTSAVALPVSMEPPGFGTERIDKPPITDTVQGAATERPVEPAATVYQPQHLLKTVLGRRIHGVPWAVLAGGMGLVLLAVAFGVARFTFLSQSSTVASPSLASRGKPVAVWGGTAGSGRGQFKGPLSLALDPQGNIYVADTGNNRIQKLSPTGSVLAVWGTTGSTPLHFAHPDAVAIDRHGNVYVTDTGNYRVQKLSPQGKFLAQWRGSGRAQFAAPGGVAVDGSDTVYVTDSENDTIFKLSPTGSVIATWRRSGSRPGQFLGPAGLAADTRGNVYVADSDNNRIQKLSPTGKPLAVWGTTGSRPGQFNAPTFVALDVWGNVYVADNGNNRIQKLSRTGKPLAMWGVKGSKGGAFQSPAGVAVDVQGNAYVADTGNNRIQKFSSAGHMLFQWGKTGSGAGQFHGPTGVAIDRQGKVYVSDAQNHRIQKFSSTGRLLGRWGIHGPGPGQFVLPAAVAVDSEQSIYVADARQDTIQKFSSVGKPLARWGSPGSGPGQFDFPLAVAVDYQGNVYVADSGNTRIQKLSPSGKPLAQWQLPGPAIAIPSGLAVDAHGNVYVTESIGSSRTSRSRIRKLSPTGKQLAVWGDGSTPTSRFGYLYGIAVDAQGNVYVADPGHPLDQDPRSYNGRARIHQLSPSGRSLVVWGTSGLGFGQLRFPTGMTVDSQGSVYVADAGNDRILKISPSG